MSNTHKCVFWCGKIIEFSYAENIHQLVSMAPIDIEVGCRAVTTGKLVSPRLSNNAPRRHAGSAHVGSRRRSSRAWGGGERDHQPQRSDGFSSHPPRPVSLLKGERGPLDCRSRGIDRFRVSAETAVPARRTPLPNLNSWPMMISTPTGGWRK